MRLNRRLSKEDESISDKIITKYIINNPDLTITEYMKSFDVTKHKIYTLFGKLGMTPKTGRVDNDLSKEIGKAYRNMMMECKSNGEIKKYKRKKNHKHERVRRHLANNPDTPIYKCVEMYGIGYNTAKKIYDELGIDPMNNKRESLSRIINTSFSKLFYSKRSELTPALRTFIFRPRPKDFKDYIYDYIKKGGAYKLSEIVSKFEKSREEAKEAISSLMLENKIIVNKDFKIQRADFISWKNRYTKSTVENN